MTAEKGMTAELSSQIQKNKFWACVTVFGTLWGGLELTLGTFLHVLHVPKTGLIMVALTSILLIAQRRIFPARGSVLAAGVVAACIKCLSPGGIIAGPVFGIISEALIIELCLLAGSRNVLMGMWAASMAVLWSQLQAVFKMWIYYGTDFLQSIIKVIEKFFKVQWTSAIGWTLVISIILIVLAIGCVAGWIGNRLGARVEEQLKLTQRNAENKSESEETRTDENHALEVIEQISDKRRKKRTECLDVIRSRFILFPILLATIGVQFTSGFWLFSDEFRLLLLAFGVWILALAIGARSVLRAIWWPKFWLITFFVSVLCGIILAWQFDKTGNWDMDWRLGIQSACQMMVRGIYVFSIVTWATRCVRTSEMLSVWKRIHLPNLGEALARAYDILPAWLDRMQVLVKDRPKGMLHTLRYVRQCCYDCLVEAALQTEELSVEQ